MKVKIEKAKETGFCFGVRRAIDMLEKAAKEKGNLETLGAVVHNEQVMQKLSQLGIDVIQSPSDIKSQVVAISAHGVSPEVEDQLLAKKVEVIDTTCPSVRRAQIAAKKLVEAGFFVLIFGEAQHPEVRGILGWAQNNGLATLDVKPFETGRIVPRKLGILSQTTQIPENFADFVKKMIDLALVHGAEIRILDTICQGTRNRQSQALELARKVDLMLVVGGKSSANTRRLLEVSRRITETHLIGKADEIDLAWFQGKKYIGVTGGTSASEQTVDEVVEYIEDNLS